MLRFHIVSAFLADGHHVGCPTARPVVIPLFSGFLGKEAKRPSWEVLPPFVEPVSVFAPVSHTADGIGVEVSGTRRGHDTSANGVLQEAGGRSRVVIGCALLWASRGIWGHDTK